jgi:hypothetical protein
MSIIIKGEKDLSAYSNNIRQQYYISTYYTLTGDEISIEFKNPINKNLNEDFKLSFYNVNFGDNEELLIYPDDIVKHKYNVKGSYYISYIAIYSNGATYEYTIPDPIIVKEKWEQYDQNGIRLNDEITLKLPYTLEQIYIQPNEWGVEDIFNTSITRLQECLDYLISKTQTMNTYSPTLYFGWLGNNAGTSASTLKWITQSYNYEYVDMPEMATSTGISYFKNLTDCIEKNDQLYVIDNAQLKVFKNKAKPEEIIFSNSFEISSFLINPISLDVNDTGDIVYIADQIANNIYKLQLSIDSTNLKESKINVQLFNGGFGGLRDNDNFNTPTQILFNNDNVYVLDYNNYGIKQYNKDLNWICTYYIDEFETDRPISISVLNNGLIYVLSKNYNIYIFDNLSTNLFEKFSILETNDGYNLNKITIDNDNNFLLVLTDKNIYKYTLAGSYVSTFVPLKDDTVKYNNIKNGKNGTLLISTQKCIIKYQDILNLYRLGDGLPYKYWNYDQLKVNKNEFATDLIYNRSLIRITQNIKTFRGTLNAKFILANENINRNIITYFSYLPIDINDIKYEKYLKFKNDIENDLVLVGVNELHVPSVINKELKKLYDALIQLSEFLNIENYTIKNSDCVESFCWSWNAMSCYNLTLPVIKTCNINPISYGELHLNEQNVIKYTNDKTWGEATSKCCE